MSVNLPEIYRNLIRSVPGLTGDDGLAPGGVVVGPPNEGRIKRGVVSVAENGTARLEVDALLTYGRYTIRVQGPTIRQVELIASALVDFLHPNGDDYKSRRVVLQNSTEEAFLIHYSKIAVGPNFSVNPEQKFVFEEMMSVEICVGREPVSAPA